MKGSLPSIAPQGSLQFIPYTADDFSYCNSLIKENMGSYFEQYGISWEADRFRRQADEGILRICQIGEVRVGFFHLSEKDNQGYVNTIQVGRLYRNLGIGKKMLKQIEALFSTRNYSLIRLKVYKESPAIRLYESMGYAIESAQATQYLMQKEL